MKLEEIWKQSGENIDNYFSILEFHGISDTSTAYVLSSLEMELYCGMSYDTITKSSIPNMSDLDIYAIGGTSTVDAYSTVEEYREYRRCIKNIKNKLNSI